MRQRSDGAMDDLVAVVPEAKVSLGNLHAEGRRTVLENTHWNHKQLPPENACGELVLDMFGPGVDSPRWHNWAHVEASYIEVTSRDERPCQRSSFGLVDAGNMMLHALSRSRYTLDKCGIFTLDGIDFGV